MIQHEASLVFQSMFATLQALSEFLLHLSLPEWDWPALDVLEETLRLLRKLIQNPFEFFNLMVDLLLRVMYTLTEKWSELEMVDLLQTASGLLAVNQVLAALKAISMGLFKLYIAVSQYMIFRGRNRAEQQAQMVLFADCVPSKEDLIKMQEEIKKAAKKSAEIEKAVLEVEEMVSRPDDELTIEEVDQLLLKYESLLPATEKRKLEEKLLEVKGEYDEVPLPLTHLSTH